MERSPKDLGKELARADIGVMRNRTSGAARSAVAVQREAGVSIHEESLLHYQDWALACLATTRVIASRLDGPRAEAALDGYRKASRDGPGFPAAVLAKYGPVSEPEEIGEVYARLCGYAGNLELRDWGVSLFKETTASTTARLIELDRPAPAPASGSGSAAVSALSTADDAPPQRRRTWPKVVVLGLAFLLVAALLRACEQ